MKDFLQNEDFREMRWTLAQASESFEPSRKKQSKAQPSAKHYIIKQRQK